MVFCFLDPGKKTTFEASSKHLLLQIWYFLQTRLQNNLKSMCRVCMLTRAQTHVVTQAIMRPIMHGKTRAQKCAIMRDKTHAQKCAVLRVITHWKTPAIMHEIMRVKTRAIMRAIMRVIMCEIMHGSTHAVTRVKMQNACAKCVCALRHERV